MSSNPGNSMKISFIWESGGKNVDRNKNYVMRIILFVKNMNRINCETKSPAKILGHQLSNLTLTISRYTIRDLERLKG